MKKWKPSIDENTLKILYHKHREFVLPTLIIFLCISLLAQFVMPQFDGYQKLKKEEEVALARTKELKEKINFLSSLDPASLDSQLKKASLSLPSEKDYAGIINAISKSAAGSAVGLSDYSFTIGDLATPSAQIVEIPSIQISLFVRTGNTGAVRFLKELSDVFPLSEVTSVQLDGSSTTMNTYFFYKAFPMSKEDY